MSNTQRLQTAIQALAGKSISAPAMMWSSAADCCGSLEVLSSEVPYPLHGAVVADFLKTTRAVALAGLSQLITREFATAGIKTDKKVKVEKEKEKVDVLSSLKAGAAKGEPIQMSFYYSRKISIDTKFQKEAKPRIVKPQSDGSALAANADLNARLAGMATSLTLPIAPAPVVVKVLQLKIARGTVAVKAGFTIRTGTTDLKYPLADASTTVIMEEEALRISLPDVDETTELVNLAPLLSDALPAFSAAQSPIESTQVVNFVKMVKALNKNTEFVANLTKLLHTPGSKCGRIKDLAAFLRSPLVPLVLRDEKKDDKKDEKKDEKKDDKKKFGHVSFAALPNDASKTMSDRYIDRLKETLSAFVVAESVVPEPEWDEKWEFVDAFADEGAARVAVDKKLNDAYGQSGSSRLHTPVAIASIALLAHWIIELSAAASSLIAIPKMSREKALEALGQSDVPSNSATYAAAMGQVQRNLLPAHRLRPAAIDLAVDRKTDAGSSGAAKTKAKAAKFAKSADSSGDTSKAAEDELFGRCKLIPLLSRDDRTASDAPMLSSRVDGGETTIKLETETSKSFSIKGPASIVSFVNAQFGKKPNQFACLIEASAESIVLIGFAPSKDSAFSPERLFRLGARDSLRIPTSLVTMPADAEFEKHLRTLGTSRLWCPEMGCGFGRVSSGI